MSGINIKAILSHTIIASMYCDEIIRSEKLSGTQKHIFRGFESKLRSIEREICVRTSQESAQAIRDEVTQNWETLSFHNIFTMLQTMTDEQRRIIEEVCGAVLNNTFKIETE